MSSRFGRRRTLLLLGAAICLMSVVAIYKLLPRLYNARKLALLRGRDVYDEKADARQELARALESAKATRKRVLLILGGDWCQWCLVLDDLLKTDQQLKLLISRRFVTLKLDADSASGIDEPWGNPTKNGVPVVVVLGADGRLLHVQDMLPLETWGGRLLSYDRDAVHALLTRWSE